MSTTRCQVMLAGSMSRRNIRRLLRGRQVGQRLGLDAQFRQAAALPFGESRRPWADGLGQLLVVGLGALVQHARIDRRGQQVVAPR